MAIPKWLDRVIDLGVAFVGSVLAHEVQEEKEEKKKKTPLEAIGEEVRKVLTPDREDVEKELQRLGPEGEAIRRLLDEANTLHGGIITEGGMRRTENWVINMLLKVEPKDREWMFSLWNRICEEDRAEFLAALSRLDNDGYLQYPRLIAASARGGLARLDHSLGPVADRLEDIAEGR